MTAVLAPEGIDSLITTEEAAQLCGVQVVTIRQWIARQKLTISGVDDRGRNLYRLIDVARAEYSTRKNARRQ